MVKPQSQRWLRRGCRVVVALIGLTAIEALTAQTHSRPTRADHRPVWEGVPPARLPEARTPDVDFSRQHLKPLSTAGNGMIQRQLWIDLDWNRPRQDVLVVRHPAAVESGPRVQPRNAAAVAAQRLASRLRSTVTVLAARLRHPLRARSAANLTPPPPPLLAASDERPRHLPRGADAITPGRTRGGSASAAHADRPHGQAAGPSLASRQLNHHAIRSCVWFHALQARGPPRGQDPLQ